jgi:hypothetical protein
MREGGFYKLLANSIKHGALVHGSDKLCELWHKRFGHLHYRALPRLKDIVQGLLDFNIKKIGLCTRRACQDYFPKQ